MQTWIALPPGSSAQHTQSLINTGLTPLSTHTCTHGEPHSTPLITHLYLLAACTALHCNHHVLSSSHMCTSGPSPLCNRLSHTVPQSLCALLEGQGWGGARELVCAEGHWHFFFRHLSFSCKTIKDSTPVVPCCSGPQRLQHSETVDFFVFLNMHEVLSSVHQSLCFGACTCIPDDYFSTPSAWLWVKTHHHNVKTPHE